MPAFRVFTALAVLVLPSFGWAASVAKFHWDNARFSDGHDLLRLELTGPKELRFVYERPVAKYWGVLSAESYLRFNTVQKLAVWDRHDPRDQHSLIMRTLNPLKPGRYSFHLVVEGYPESKGMAFEIAQETGSFEIVR